MAYYTRDRARIMSWQISTETITSTSTSTSCPWSYLETLPSRYLLFPTIPLIHDLRYTAYQKLIESLIWSFAIFVSPYKNAIAMSSSSTTNSQNDQYDDLSEADLAQVTTSSSPFWDDRSRSFTSHQTPPTTLSLTVVSTVIDVLPICAHIDFPLHMPRTYWHWCTGV